MCCHKVTFSITRTSDFTVMRMIHSGWTQQANRVTKLLSWCERSVTPHILDSISDKIEVLVVAPEQLCSWGVHTQTFTREIKNWKKTKKDPFSLISSLLDYCNMFTCFNAKAVAQPRTVQSSAVWLLNALLTSPQLTSAEHQRTSTNLQPFLSQKPSKISWLCVSCSYRVS